MNSHLVSEKPVIGVTNLRNSRAITCALSLTKRRLDVEYFIHNLLRPDLISASLADNLSAIVLMLKHPNQSLIIGPHVNLRQEQKLS